MKKVLQTLLTLCVGAVFSYEMMAQQDPYTTHYMFNRRLYNPASIGAKGQFCFSALSHYQYTGFSDRTPEFWPDKNNPSNTPSAVRGVGPKTQMFSFGAPINFKDAGGNQVNYGGVGIGFIKDKLGYESSTHVKVGLAGRLPLSNGGAIALGAEVNFLQKGIDGKKLKPLVPNDPRIPTDNVSQMKPNFSAGVYYNRQFTNSTWVDHWVGLSAVNLVKAGYDYTLPGGLVIYNTKTHFYLMGGATKEDFLGNPNLKFHPSAMLKYESVFQAELTGLVEYQDKLWGGLAYRSTADALSIMLGYDGFKGKLENLRIGYAYDLTLSRILKASSGSHEIQLNYCFSIKLPPKTFIPKNDPRHLNKSPFID